MLNMTRKSSEQCTILVLKVLGGVGNALATSGIAGGASAVLLKKPPGVPSSPGSTGNLRLFSYSYLIISTVCVILDLIG